MLDPPDATDGDYSYPSSSPRDQPDYASQETREIYSGYLASSLYLRGRLHKEGSDSYAGTQLNSLSLFSKNVCNPGAI